jgi:hypothetical protein
MCNHGVRTTVNHAILTTRRGHASLAPGLSMTMCPLLLSVLTFVEISCVRSSVGHAV